MSMLHALNIAVTFDLVCPWCWIAKRNLDHALLQIRSDFPKSNVRVRWRGVQLLPTVPDEGVPFLDFYRNRLGGEGAMRLRQQQVSAMAEQAGVQINFERIETFPNTFKAHRLLDFVGLFGSNAQHMTLLENLFSAYFSEGRNIGDSKILLDAASAIGMSAPLMLEIALFLGVGDAPTEARSQSPAEPRSPPAQFSSVPHIVINGQQHLFGAESSEDMIRAFSNTLTIEPTP